MTKKYLAESIKTVRSENLSSTISKKLSDKKVLDFKGKKLKNQVSEKTKGITMWAYAFVVLLSAFIFNSPYEIFNGLFKIATDPSILVSDYMQIANIGAALFNSGLLIIICLLIVKKSKTKMSGLIIAAILTVGGFALFGKNIYNIWSILLGVKLYSIFKGEKFSKNIVVALFGTAIAPIISQVSFGLGFPIIAGVIVGNALGCFAGFILPPLAKHFVKFHQGFNLYNMGFTAGVVGMLFMSVFRALGIENEKRMILSSGNNEILGIYLFALFTTMIIVGFIMNNKTFDGLKDLLNHTGKGEDFIATNGFGITLVNMGMLGFVATIYVLLANGQLNGPTIGGIYTVAGFAGFGKHVKNTVPVMLGIVIVSMLTPWEINSLGVLLAALFGTTLAPIAGEFGWKSGILAGFLHMAVVMNVGYLHGGMNLYNNGLAGGLVAGILIPILYSVRENKQNKVKFSHA